MDEFAIKPRFLDAVRVYVRIGLLSFGGPAGQIALMHRELVEDRCWITEEQYLYALNFCHLLPGPEAQQLATWIGWRLHGVKGGLAAGMLFILPGAMIMLVLSMLYGLAADLSWFEALFLGIKAAVFAIVLQALLRIGGRALDTGFKKALAVASFCALFLFNLPFPLVILGAGAFGMILASARPEWLGIKTIGGRQDEVGPRPWGETVRAVVIWGAIWTVPLLLIWVSLGTDHILWKIGIFFSQLAVVTFGGAYAVLAYMAQEAVNGFGWLQPGEMADGLGLAETTPGPLIMVTQFVGYLAAFRAPEPFAPLIGGIIGALVTTWVTFAPCFLWIFALAPWIERLQNIRWLKGSLAAITAAVVGVIANLTLWFALHVLFQQVGRVAIGPTQLDIPDWATIEWRAALLGLVAIVLIFVLRYNILKLLIIMAFLGFVIGQI